MVMFGDKKAYGENGLTGQGETMSFTDQSGASGVTPQPTSPVSDDSNFMPPPGEPPAYPDPEPATYEPKTTPGFVSEPVVDQPTTTTPIQPPAAGGAAPAAGPLALLTRKIFGVPVWLAAAAAAAWWWRQRNA